MLKLQDYNIYVDNCLTLVGLSSDIEPLVRKMTSDEEGCLLNFSLDQLAEYEEWGTPEHIIPYNTTLSSGERIYSVNFYSLYSPITTIVQRLALANPKITFEYTYMINHKTTETYMRFRFCGKYVDFENDPCSYSRGIEFGRLGNVYIPDLRELNLERLKSQYKTHAYSHKCKYITTLNYPESTVPPMEPINSELSDDELPF